MRWPLVSRARFEKAERMLQAKIAAEHFGRNSMDNFLEMRINALEVRANALDAGLAALKSPPEVKGIAPLTVGATQVLTVPNLVVARSCSSRLAALRACLGRRG